MKYPCVQGKNLLLLPLLLRNLAPQQPQATHHIRFLLLLNLC